MKMFTFHLSRHDETQDTFRFDDGEDPKEALVDWVLNTVEFWMEEETGND